jgi:hypothetical protein
MCLFDYISCRLLTVWLLLCSCSILRELGGHTSDELNAAKAACQSLPSPVPSSSDRPLSSVRFGFGLRWLVFLPLGVAAASLVALHIQKQR